MSRDHDPCDETNSVLLKICIDKQIELRLGCNLPWTLNEKQVRINMVNSFIMYNIQTCILLCHVISYTIHTHTVIVQDIPLCTTKEQFKNYSDLTYKLHVGGGRRALALFPSCPPPCQRFYYSTREFRRQKAIVPLKSQRGIFKVTFDMQDSGYGSVKETWR